MRDDGDLGAEDEVGSRMVTMVVGVEDELQLAPAYVLQGGAELVGQRGVLVVDDQDAVLAHRDPDVAPSPVQHVDVAAHVLGLNFDVFVLLLGHGRNSQPEGKGHQRTPGDTFQEPPPPGDQMTY